MAVLLCCGCRVWMTDLCGPTMIKFWYPLLKAWWSRDTHGPLLYCGEGGHAAAGPTLPPLALLSRACAYGTQGFPYPTPTLPPRARRGWGLRTPNTPTQSTLRAALRTPSWGGGLGPPTLTPARGEGWAHLTRPAPPLGLALGACLPPLPPLLLKRGGGGTHNLRRADGRGSFSSGLWCRGFGQPSLVGIFTPRARALPTRSVRSCTRMGGSFTSGL